MKLATRTIDCKMCQLCLSREQSNADRGYYHMPICYGNEWNFSVLWSFDVSWAASRPLYDYFCLYSCCSRAQSYRFQHAPALQSRTTVVFFFDYTLVNRYTASHESDADSSISFSLVWLRKFISALLLLKINAPFSLSLSRLLPIVIKKQENGHTFNSMTL